MKVEQFNDSSIQTFGDIQENKVGIDRENVDFITTLLTSNLYSRPLGSFLRETVSNAYDSHVEAGTDDPIIILIRKCKDSKHYELGATYDISVRDYGVGISPERFQKIYTNIGSSTKRESNNYIGGWGIGRFAALAVSDTVIINSYYNNTKYTYIMYKNGTSINIDKTAEIPIKEEEFKRGVEVIATNIQLAKYNVLAELSCLSLFTDLRVVGIEVPTGSAVDKAIQKFNERQVYKGEVFWATNMAEEFSPSVALGNIIYKLDTSALPAEAKSRANYLRTLAGAHILIPCEIGSVHVTPNREDLRYSDKTVKCISEKLEAIDKEVHDRITKSLTRDFDCLWKLTRAYTGAVSAEILAEPYIMSYAVDKKAVQQAFTLNGKIVPAIYYHRLNSVGRREIYANKLTPGNATATSVCKVMLMDILRHGVPLFREDARLKDTTYRYFGRQCSYNTCEYSAYVLNKSTYGDFFFEFLPKSASPNSIWPDGKYSQADIDELKQFLEDNFKLKTIKNSDVPEEFLEEFTKKKESKKPSAATLKDVNVRLYNCHSYSTYSLSTIFGYYRYNGTKGKTVIYTTTTKEDDLIKFLCQLVNLEKAAFITIPKIYLHFIPKHNRKFVPLQEFLTSKFKLLVEAFTYNYIRENLLEDNYYPYSAVISRTKKFGVYAIPSSLPHYAKWPVEIQLLYDKYVKNHWLNYNKINDCILTEFDKNWFALFNSIFKDRWHPVVFVMQQLLLNGNITLNWFNKWFYKSELADWKPVNNLLTQLKK